jgi:hypothetical protein
MIIENVGVSKGKNKIGGCKTPQLWPRAQHIAKKELSDDRNRVYQISFV